MTKEILSAEAAFDALSEFADEKQAALVSRYFKTGPGQYGYGDKFLGLKVPVTRAAVKRFADMPFDEISRLLKNPWHEARLLGLLILVRRMKAEPEKAFAVYSKHLAYVNNWDLVDLSAPYIVGPHTELAGPAFIRGLVKSPVLWERRVAIISTLYQIRLGDCRETLYLLRRLLNDKEDLMHKACGWALREVGKHDAALARGFLDRYAPEMPRTMLRYAIERLSPEVRKHYLSLR